MHQRCSVRAAQKCDHGGLAEPGSIGLGQREWLIPMSQSPDAAADQTDASDLISFLRAITDGRSRRGVRSLQWFLLLVAVVGILSG
jgi:hypothetical protein